MTKEGIVNEIHRSARKRFPRRRVLQVGINDTWQIDLVEMIPHSHQNSGYKYILTIIDIFSKMAYAAPLKSKTAVCVTSAMQGVLDKSKVQPRSIHSDEGKEFFNALFQRLMKSRGIHHYHTYTFMKASIIERFNRTIKFLLQKKFSLNGNYKWVSILPKLINTYNNTKHRTIQMKPIDVSITNEREILDIYRRLESQVKTRRKNDLELGDHVRISKAKGIFQKGYLPNWSTEIFQIKTIVNSQPTTYLLNDLNEEDILGCFYREELQKTFEVNNYLVEKVLKQKKDKVLVRWLGFPESADSWIDKKDLI